MNADVNEDEVVSSLYSVLKAYERWEADLIQSQEAWDGGRSELPTLTHELWDRLLELQAIRNAVIARADGITP